jgi:Cu/Ag efflux protein CusF
MKKLIAAAIALPLLATVALAADQTDTGTIKRISAAKGTLELSDGKMFSVPKSIKLGGFKNNEKVTVVYTMTNGKMLATSVVAAK